jgi:hypothetical protein
MRTCLKQLISHAQIFTLEVPFGDFRTSSYKLATDVINGVRPPRPLHAGRIGMDDRMWGLMVYCWNPSPKHRGQPAIFIPEAKLAGFQQKPRIVGVETPAEDPAHSEYVPREDSTVLNPVTDAELDPEDATTDPSDRIGAAMSKPKRNRKQEAKKTKRKKTEETNKPAPTTGKHLPHLLFDVREV